MANTKILSEQIADSVALAGSPTTTTQSASDNSTKVATTAYVTTAVANLVDSAPSSLNTLNELAAAMNDNASFFSTVLPLSGGTMTGNLTISTSASTILNESTGSWSILRLKSPSANGGYIQFADAEDDDVGQIFYYHGSGGDYMSFTTNASEAMRILSNQRVSIGGSSANHLLNVTSSTTPALEFTRGSGNATIGIDNGNSIAVGGTAGDLVIRASGTTGVTRFTDSGGNITMTLTEANNVVIGSVAGGTATATPVELNLGSTFANSVGSLSKAKLKVFEDSSANVYGLSVSSGLFEFGVPSSAGYAFFIGESEKMRILANGTLLVGKSADDNSVGFKTNTSSTYMVASGGTPTFINRLSDNGDLLEFRKDSSTKGRIGTDGSDIFIGSDDTNLLFHADGFLPANSVGGVRDNAFALGSSSARYTDLRLSGIMYSGTALINTTTSRSGAAVNVRAGSNQIQVIFQNSATTTIGYIGNVSDSSTLYSTSSDERLKENITDADESGSKIDAIRVRQFDWKVNGLHQDYGMVAQELQAVAPEAVYEPEDPDDMMGVDYSKLVPMLLKEIQSLRARVAQLESN